MADNFFEATPFRTPKMNSRRIVTTLNQTIQHFIQHFAQHFSFMLECDQTMKNGGGGGGGGLEPLLAQWLHAACYTLYIIIWYIKQAILSFYVDNKVVLELKQVTS